MANPPRYDYTGLQSLPDSGRVNVYGVVRSITTLTFGGQLIEIEDEHSTAYVRVLKQSEGFFKNLQISDILRLHRAEIGSYRNEKTLIVEVGAYGCHAVAWSNSSSAPTLVTSKKHTSSEDDYARRSALCKWLENRESNEQLDATTSTGDGGVQTEDPHHELLNVVSSNNRKKSPAKPNLCKTVSYASEIPALWTKFFNWYSQVLGVYKGKGEPFTVFLRVWDGTLPRFPDYRNMFRADGDSIEVTFCEASPSVLQATEAYFIDVCCYGEWANKATKLKVGDIIFLCNVRNYTCKSKNSSAVTMHEGGEAFSRALTVVDENDPIHYEISKRCADSLSECLGPDNNLLDSILDESLSPIIADDVLAQSTPIASKEDVADILPALPERAEPSSSDLIEVINATVDGNGMEQTCVPTSEDGCLPEDVREEFVKKIESVCREYEIEHLLSELSEPAVLQYGLTEEMEAILKMEVGQRFSFFNFVEAELKALKEAEYLRNAVVFTAVCEKCSDEFVVERGAKAWCRECFTERKILQPVRYYYRIAMPAVYSRSNGQTAQLILAIGGSIWAGIPSNNMQMMSIENVLQLYYETNLTVFVRRLNDVIRFAEAVMTKMKVSDVCGKITAVDRSTGSITLFVDQCVFTERGRNDAIYI